MMKMLKFENFQDEKTPLKLKFSLEESIDLFLVLFTFNTRFYTHLLKFYLQHKEGILPILLHAVSQASTDIHSLFFNSDSTFRLIESYLDSVNHEGTTENT